MTAGRGVGAGAGGSSSGPGQTGSNEYSGGGYTMNLAGPYGRDNDDGERGRKPSRTPGDGGSNPFDDDMAASLRGVSPRPMDGGAAGGRDSIDGRRSAFREDV